MQASCPLSCLQITELCMHGSSSGAHFNESHFFVYSASQHSTPCNGRFAFPLSLPQKSYCNMPILFGASPNFDHVTGEPRGQQLTRPREGEMEGWRALFVLMCVMSHCCPACGWNRCQLTGCCFCYELSNGLKSGSKVARIVCIILTWCCHSKCVHFYPSLVVHQTELIP